jgi:hypothetical protein
MPGTSQTLDLDKENVSLTSEAQEFNVNVNRDGWTVRALSFEIEGNTIHYLNRKEVPDLHGTKIIAADTFKAEWIEVIKVDSKTITAKAQANNSGRHRTAQVALRAGNTGAGFVITQDK